MPRGCQTRHYTGDRADADSEQHHPWIETDIGRTGHVGHGGRPQHVQTTVRNGDTCHAAYRCQQQALYQQLADDAAAPAADGGADGHFTRPRGRTDQEQARQVRAGDQEQHADCAEQQSTTVA